MEQQPKTLEMIFEYVTNKPDGWSDHRLRKGGAVYGLIKSIILDNDIKELTSWRNYYRTPTAPNGIQWPEGQAFYQRAIDQLNTYRKLGGEQFPERRRKVWVVERFSPSTEEVGFWRGDHFTDINQCNKVSYGKAFIECEDYTRREKGDAVFSVRRVEDAK